MDYESELVSSEFIADPYPVLRQMRETDPVYWSEAVGGWILTRYDDIVVTFKDTVHYSNEDRLGQSINYLPPERRAPFQPFADHFAKKSLLHSDPPIHTRLREVVTNDFNLKLVQRMRPRIQEMIDELLDEVEKKGGMEVIAEFATPLPVGVISCILGVPAADHGRVRTWANAVIAVQGVNKPSEEDLGRATQAIQEIRPYISAMMEERRKAPRDDLMSKFVAAEAQGGRISEDELITTCVTLFVAGHETTVALLSNATYLLLSHPDQLRILRENPDAIISTIEECLRYESPVSRQPRRMKADVELGGKMLKKGQIAMQMINAANRDPAYFVNPETFDVRRQKNRHMAFGQGVHNCVGAPLARAEGLLAIGSLVKRFSNLRLVDSKADWDVNKRSSRVLNALHITG